MRKTPNRANSTGAFGQLSFLPTPEFCPILPTAGTKAAQALADLVERDITQIDWLVDGMGWRLSAAVKELDYLGWEPKSTRVNRGRANIALYSLPAKAKATYATMNRGGDHAAK